MRWVGGGPRSTTRCRRSPSPRGWCCKRLLGRPGGRERAPAAGGAGAAPRWPGPTMRRRRQALGALAGAGLVAAVAVVLAGRPLRGQERRAVTARRGGGRLRHGAGRLGAPSPALPAPDRAGVTAPTSTACSTTTPTRRRRSRHSWRRSAPPGRRSRAATPCGRPTEPRRRSTAVTATTGPSTTRSPARWPRTGSLAADPRLHGAVGRSRSPVRITRRRDPSPTTPPTRGRSRRATASGGAFWRAHPELTPQPVTAIEIWNEPDNREFWAPAPDAAAYAGLYLDRARGDRRRRPGDPGDRGRPHPRAGVPAGDGGRGAGAARAHRRRGDPSLRQPRGGGRPRARGARRPGGHRHGRRAAVRDRVRLDHPPPRSLRPTSPASRRPALHPAASWRRSGTWTAGWQRPCSTPGCTPERNPADGQDWYGIASPTDPSWPRRTRPPSPPGCAPRSAPDPAADRLPCADLRQLVATAPLRGQPFERQRAVRERLQGGLDRHVTVVEAEQAGEVERAVRGSSSPIHVYQ